MDALRVRSLRCDLFLRAAAHFSEAGRGAYFVFHGSRRRARCPRIAQQRVEARGFYAVAAQRGACSRRGKRYFELFKIYIFARRHGDADTRCRHTAAPPSAASSTPSPRRTSLTSRQIALKRMLSSPSYSLMTRRVSRPTFTHGRTPLSAPPRHAGAPSPCRHATLLRYLRGFRPPARCAPPRSRGAAAQEARAQAVL